MYITIFNEKELRKKKEKFSKDFLRKMYALMYGLSGGDDL